MDSIEAESVRSGCFAAFVQDAVVAGPGPPTGRARDSVGENSRL